MSRALAAGREPRPIIRDRAKIPPDLEAPENWGFFSLGAAVRFRGSNPPDGPDEQQGGAEDRQPYRRWDEVRMPRGRLRSLAHVSSDHMKPAAPSIAWPDHGQIMITMRHPMLVF